MSSASASRHHFAPLHSRFPYPFEFFERTRWQGEPVPRIRGSGGFARRNAVRKPVSRRCCLARGARGLKTRAEAKKGSRLRRSSARNGLIDRGRVAVGLFHSIGARRIREFSERSNPCRVFKRVLAGSLALACT